MFSTARLLRCSFVTCFMMLITVCTGISSPYELRCQWPTPPSCNCSNTPHGYTLLCHVLTVQVKTKGVVYIECPTNESDFSVLNGVRMREVATLIIEQCPLQSVSLVQLMQNMDESNIRNVQFTYTGMNGNSATTVTRELFHGLSNVTSLTLHTDRTIQLTNDVFTDTTNLIFIDLKSNNIVLSKNVFCNVMNLEVLQLRSNNVTYLEPGVFHNLTQLRLLVFSGNIHNISRTVFSDIPNLQSLYINSTKMTNLPGDLFVDLINLRKISLYGNGFLHLPQNLFIKNINLETVNIEGNRQTINELLFGELTKLKEVRLNSLNMSTLPEQLFWNSPLMRSLSLKNNALITLPEDMFFAGEEIQILDISFNQITHLPLRLFATTSKIVNLKINNNQLNVIRQDLFRELMMLRVLDLKDNKLTHIEANAFAGLISLKVLNMSNNLFQHFGLFEQEIPFNKILWYVENEIRENSFRGLYTLEELQLANNSLTMIFPDRRMVKSLRTLNLAHNKITHIRPSDLLFSGVEDTFVNVSYNKIYEIDIFDGETFYKYANDSEIYNVPVRHIFLEGNPVDLDCNNYRFLQYDAHTIISEINLTTNPKPENLQCGNLKTYSGQPIENIPLKYFICLGKIEQLDCPKECPCFTLLSGRGVFIGCKENNATLIPIWEDLLHYLSYDPEQLVLLYIRSSKVTNIPHDLFRHMKNLRKINFNRNHFLDLPQNLFTENQKLKIFELENNKKTVKSLPSKLLAHLTMLQNVKIHSCNMSTLPDDLLWDSTSINTISLSNNSFTTLPEMLFKDCTELHTLDISFNRITHLPSQLFLFTRNLKTLKSNNNQLTVITKSLFSSLKELIYLDLKDNRLKHVETQAFAALSSLKVLNMSNNNITFDDTSENSTISLSPLKFCDMLEDIQLANNSLNKIFADWQKLKYLKILNLAHNKMSQLQGVDLYLTATKDTFVNVSYNNISNIDIFNNKIIYKYGLKNKEYNVPVRYIFSEGNPLNCGCKVFNFLQHVGDNIAADVLLIMETKPDNLHGLKPREHTEQKDKIIPIQNFICLFERGYNLNCPEQCTCLLMFSKKALIVDCHQRNLTSMPEALPDVAFSDYTELNLSRNNIKSVKWPLGRGYNKVTKWILSENKISEIDLTAFSTKLQVLDVRGNCLNQFNNPSIEFLTNATYLTQLTLHNNPWRCNCLGLKFRTAVQANFYLRQIKPLDKVTCENGKEILKMSDTELCPVETPIAVYVSYIVAALGLLIGVLLALYYKFKNGIKIWLYAHRWCLWFVSEDELDKNKLYDAFIGYAYQDEAFVMDQLVPRLENYNYTLCLHQRDWIPGEFIPAQIARSVEDSRRTLIVLSPAFLNSVWGRMEFCAAHKQALNEGRARVIIILYADIGSLDKLDSEFRTYLTMNTYVKWGDKWFWEKLRYGMPHSSKFSNGIPLHERA